MDLNKQKVQMIIDDTKSKGLPTEMVLDDLIMKGYNLEGIDSNKRRMELNPQETVKVQGESVPEKIANFTGGKELAQGAGQSLAQGFVGRQSDEALKQGLDIQNRLIEKLKEARESGNKETESVMINQLQNIDFGQGIQQGFSDDLVSDREVIGSAVQLAGTAGGGFAASKAMGATAGLSPIKQLVAGGAAEGLVQGFGFGAGNEIKNEDATLGSVLTAGAKDAAFGTVIGGAGAGLIGGAGKFAGSVRRGADNILGGVDETFESASSLFRKQPITDEVLTKQEIQAGIRPDIKKSILGQEDSINEYFDVTRKRLLDETQKTPDGLLNEKALNSFKQVDDLLSDTGSEIGQARAKQGNVKATAEQAQSILNTFDTQLDSMNLRVGKNGNIIKGKGIVDISPSELKLLNETRADILRVKADPKISTIQQAVNKFRNRVDFGKKSQDLSDVVDNISRKVSSQASDVNKNILGKEAAEKYRRYSEISDFLKENKGILKNPNVALRRLLSADSYKGAEFAQTIKELTGVDLLKEARFARLAVDTFGGVNPELGTRFRQQVAGSILDTDKIISSVSGRAGAVVDVLKAIKNIPKAIRNESLLRQGIDPKMIDAEELADLIIQSAKGGTNTVDEIVEAISKPKAKESSSILDSKLFKTVIDTDKSFKDLSKRIKDTPNKQGGFVDISGKSFKRGVRDVKTTESTGEFLGSGKYFTDTEEIAKKYGKVSDVSSPKNAFLDPQKAKISELNIISDNILEKLNLSNDNYIKDFAQKEILRIKKSGSFKSFSNFVDDLLRYSDEFKKLKKTNKYKTGSLSDVSNKIASIKNEILNSSLYNANYKARAYPAKEVPSLNTKLSQDAYDNGLIFIETNNTNRNVDEIINSLFNQAKNTN